MGKTTGFLEYGRKSDRAGAPADRIGHFGEFRLPLAQEERRLQGARCMDCGVPFCQSGLLFDGAAAGCPLHNRVPEWNDALWRGDWGLAAELLLLSDDFPEFTSRVCPAPCEAACVCALHADAVSIRDNEYAIIEHAFSSGVVRPVPPSSRTGRRAAVVGSGPAGLAAANRLNRQGHSVTVYEREDRVGGLLMYGIPNMKLDKGVLDRRVRLMQSEGVRFRTSVDVGKDLSMEELLRGHDAVLLCCGAQAPRKLKAEGAQARGVHYAVDYLKAVTKGLLDETQPLPPDMDARGRRVIVVGGGDTGNDCVATVLRGGCRSVLQLEMLPMPPAGRPEDNPWPRWPRTLKTDYGQEEAAALFGRDPRVFCATVKRCAAGGDGGLRAAVLVRLEAWRDPGTGRADMREVPGSEWTEEAELLLVAAGFEGCPPAAAEALRLRLDGRGRALTRPGEHGTDDPKVFAAGDLRVGPSLVVRAIAEGISCAGQAGRWLSGQAGGAPR